MVKPYAYRYDLAGNVTSKTAQISISVPAATLTYDFNGNQTGDGVKTYEFDAANRLLAIKYPSSGTRTEFAYDGLNRRVQIVEKTGTTINSTKRFVWIGNSPVEERDSGGSNVTKRFYGEGEQIGGTAYLFTRDHLGSIREMMDLSGTVRARYAYDPWGRRTKLTGDLEADFGYTGHYYHALSGLHLALYRAYDADLGKWLSRDPLGEKGPDGPNLYEYVSDNPVDKKDPLGLLGVSGGGGHQGDYECKCKQGGGKLIPEWQKYGYSSAVNCANERSNIGNLMPDVPSPISEPLIAAAIPIKYASGVWLMALGTCLNKVCSVGP